LSARRPVSSAQRRGLCPTLIDPLPTGDGLLARWLPLTALPLAAFVTLCEAAERQGNGIVEVTQRGSLQFRGFDASTAAAFSSTVEALGLPVNSNPPIWSSPLLGLDPGVSTELRAWLLGLHGALRRRYRAQAIHPKFSVLVDDGGAMHLDATFADLRLKMGASSRLHVSIDGAAPAARALGWVALERSTEAVCEVLDQIVARGSATRAKDLDIDILRRGLGVDRAEEPGPAPRGPCEPLEAHALKDGRFARGVGLPFGFSDAARLKGLASIAEHHGADAVRPAAGRALLIIGLRPDRILEFTAQAAGAGFVVSGNDPRRHVIACAGAPACRSALMATRAMAPLVAEAAQGHIRESTVIHLSGCAKGCAHPAKAALAFVGPDRLVIEGRADEPAVDRMTAAEFIGRIPALLRGELHR
jgi:precorrin-3B synthase